MLVCFAVRSMELFCCNDSHTRIGISNSYYSRKPHSLPRRPTGIYWRFLYTQRYRVVQKTGPYLSYETRVRDDKERRSTRENIQYFI